MLRVHDVGAMRDVIRTVTAIMRYSEHTQWGTHAYAVRYGRGPRGCEFGTDDQ
jgi:hypothetical protein